MKRSLVLAALMLLPGCQNLGFSGMNADQIRATAGVTNCTAYSGLYGRGSAIALNQDDIRKGMSNKGKTTITCGDASLSIESDITTIK